ncbi:MAG: phosphonate ABC transporter ATP-binding protein [Alphaproteobacteria bacterium]|nr:phosphonate ABC transporter ATP-binding protein [Alphaproteobacteria bacterium]MDP7173120.1 phosphonate ABC transporter ATP-binding protein [Alphaproteobacteria bacterium]MDP7234873.1 phosphonate ABC transporter ATP-binding protein [Alphaproteobacteria bacterium]MDP7486639.1 phosphonate ABC transporter ATP-binding protein [Alphaproteobacteria bacterium]
MPTSNSSTEPAIEIAGLAKRFANGVEALAGVDLVIEAGSFVVVLGPSGAGKSTLLRCINGLETPSAGRTIVEDRSVEKRSLRSIRSHVAMVFQHFNLVGRLNVMTNVLCGRLGKRSTLASLIYLMRKDDLGVARRALDRVGLTDRAWDRADRLSGGQQQRVGIARALAQEPSIMLADEPVASLDPAISEEILDLLSEIQKQGITMVVSLHQVDYARRYAERIIGLNDGRVVFDGTPEALSDAVLETIYGRRNGSNGLAHG